MCLRVRLKCRPEYPGDSPGGISGTERSGKYLWIYSRYVDSLVQSESEDDCTINNEVKHAMDPHSIVLVYHADSYDHADVVLDDCVFQGKVVIAATSAKAPYQVLGSFLSHADIVSFGSLTRNTGEGHEKLGASGVSTEVPRFFRTCLAGLPLEKLVLGINEDL